MLFDPVLVRSLPLANRAVMNPMTRSRAVHAATPNALMATYYEQRATAGLIITEGTSPSPNGLGYARIPALYNDQHVRGWKLVTDAVHAQGGRIVVQLMHTGRVTHQANLPAGAKVVGPVAQPLAGEMYTDSLGMQPHTTPQAMATAARRGWCSTAAATGRAARAIASVFRATRVASWVWLTPVPPAISGPSTNTANDWARSTTTSPPSASSGYHREPLARMAERSPPATVPAPMPRSVLACWCISSRTCSSRASATSSCRWVI